MLHFQKIFPLLIMVLNISFTLLNIIQFDRAECLVWAVFLKHLFLYLHWETNFKTVFIPTKCLIKISSMSEANPC